MSAYIIDTECTDRDNGEVIELAWTKLTPMVDLIGSSDEINANLAFADVTEQRYRPEKQTTFGALAVHHILPSELEGCPPSASAKLPDDCAYIIGHNVDFDWRALGCPDVNRICTYAIAQHVWPEADSYSQSALLYMLLGPTALTRERLRNAHSALTDVHNNALLLSRILHEKTEITTWSALWEFSEDCRIPLKMPITKARGELLTDIEDGLLNWCLNQGWMPDEHPYLYKGLEREYERRERAYQDQVGKARDKHDPAPDPDDDDFPF
jgi:exodeoxyribonuclease X